MPCWPPTTCATAWSDAYEMPFAQVSKHEFVASARSIKARTGVRMLDIAKRLIDYGFHPPTIYFPLTVEEDMLVEPTETESKATLDAFADALIAIAAEAERDPQLAPRGAPRAARAPARRGHRGPPARPALAADDRRRAGLPAMSEPDLDHSPIIRRRSMRVFKMRGSSGLWGRWPWLP